MFYSVAILFSCLLSGTGSLQMMPRSANRMHRFQIYGQSVIGSDGSLEKSLAAVIRVPRHQPTNEMMPNDEPEASSGKHHFDTLFIDIRQLFRYPMGLGILNTFSIRQWTRKSKQKNLRKIKRTLWVF